MNKFYLNKISYKIRKRRRLKNKKFLKNFELFSFVRSTLSYTKNNIFITISYKRGFSTNQTYSILTWVSCGSKKFSTPQFAGSTKLSSVANHALGLYFAKCVNSLKLQKSLFFGVKGYNRFFSVLTKAFYSRVKLKTVGSFFAFDLTPISLNGCRLKKKRRV